MFEKPASVRLAGVQDEDQLYDLLVELHRENGRGWGYPYRPEIVFSRIETGTRQDQKTRSDPNDQRRSIIGVIDGENGKLCASVCLVIEPATWFTDTWCLMELWLYVRKSTRRQHRYYRDLFSFCRWAREFMELEINRGNPTYPFPVQCFTGFMNFGRVPVMERLWSRYGEKCGVLFLLK